MDFKKQFDKPLPKVNRETDRLYFETSGSFQSRLSIKSEDGEEISGRIMSNSGMITFDPEQFSGSESDIVFHVDMSMFKIGDTLKTSAVLMTNGGEHRIEIIVKMIAYAMETKDGLKISALSDFYDYVNKYPAQAKQLFRSHEFSTWLYSSAYEYMDFYEHLLKDSDKDRALSNFLAFNGYKEEKNYALPNKWIKVKIAPHMDIYVGSIKIIKSEPSASVNINTALKHSCDWLKLEKEFLTDEDFAETGEAFIGFIIDPAKLKAKRGRQAILIGDDEVTLAVEIVDDIEVFLEKEYLPSKESSFIHIKNNSASPVMVEILAVDSLIKFENKKISVKESAKVPFHVEISALHSAQFALMRQPELRSEIIVSASVSGGKYRKKLPLTIGWF